MKLSTYAKEKGISYRTAHRMWKRGELQGYQLSTGTIILENSPSPTKGVVIYARVSSAENKDNLESQAKRLVHYCEAKGYQVNKVVKEIGSGVNDKRRKLSKLLNQDDYHLIVVEHKDRLTRVGFNYLETLLNKQGKFIEVVNLCEEETEDIRQDLISIITSFCARIYGLRMRKRKTECIVKCLSENETSSKTSN
ncbi:Resolvase domain protein [Halothece sp. PCC 7418]|uniref:IS607 family transposase n=1 Tax=Halothece sp. (strain PCC 7418) TaxID=65093 RepID=UPI0002A07E6C|nr:IS607 family transposase [Halothece sp. PCC 7418]AFZ43046.1 Resolvase domain protein [Halothece sp. PCC 7418]